jgi:hypothetical protein
MGRGEDGQIREDELREWQEEWQEARRGQD